MSLTAFQFFDLTTSAADLSRLSRFYESLFIAGFPDADERESLENMIQYLYARESGWYAAEGPKNSYHIVLAEQGGRIVGAIVADYLAIPNVGVVEFLLVAEECRSQKLGSRLHEYVVSLLRHDAHNAGYAEVDGVVIELNDPFQVPAHTDNMDPFVRTRIWGKWGYQCLNFPYVQPALSEDQQPVTCLILALKPTSSRWKHSVPSPTARDIVHEYIKWAMRITDPAENMDYQNMHRALMGMQEVNLIRLQHYVGHDESLPFEFEEVTSTADPLFEQVMQVYQDSFTESETAISPQGFADASDRSASPASAFHYHLVGIRESPDHPITGMASFFALPSCGFLGYLTLTKPLAGTGRCALVLARLEEMLFQNNPEIKGWYLECEHGTKQAAIFEKLGFRKVPIDYTQPELARIDPNAGEARSHSLDLMHKRLGRVSSNVLVPTAVQKEEIEEIMTYVYSEVR